jgi:hypothetical protein
LVVLVPAPKDFYEVVEARVADYLRAGVRLLWVVTLTTRTVRIHFADGRAAYLHEADELDGGDVLPGFCCRVAALFADPAGAPAAS